MMEIKCYKSPYHYIRLDEDWLQEMGGKQHKPVGHHSQVFGGPVGSLCVGSSTTSGNSEGPFLYQPGCSTGCKTFYFIKSFGTGLQQNHLDIVHVLNIVEPRLSKFYNIQTFNSLLLTKVSQLDKSSVYNNHYIHCYQKPLQGVTVCECLKSSDISCFAQI